MKYYGVVTVFDRFDQETKRVSYDFPPNEDIRMIAAVLVNTAANGKKQTEKDYKAYRKQVDLESKVTGVAAFGGLYRPPAHEIAYYYEIEHDDSSAYTGKGKNHTRWYAGEEWEIGLGRTKREAEKHFAELHVKLGGRWDE